MFNKMFNKMFTQYFRQYFRQFIFLIKMFYIITSEYGLFCLFKDYTLFIDRLTLMLADINLLYVKLFQAFALNNSLIDDATNNKLLRFTDNAPFNKDDILYEELLQLAEDENLVIDDPTNITPINSGMIALVFKYKHKETNKDVIIKMKRRNIEQQMQIAIENLQAFLYILSFIPIIKKYQITDVVNNNLDMIQRQTNFEEEVENMILMKKNCKNLKYVKIPDVNPVVTQKYPNFIMMEFIEGLKITQIQEEHYEDFAKVVIKYGFVTTVVHGFAHGDLHSGNILFIKDDDDSKYPHKIGVLDFGIIFKIEATYKNVLFDVLTEMFIVPAEETAEKIMRSGIIEPLDILLKLPSDIYINILKIATEIIRETTANSKKANQIQIYKFLYQFKEYLSKKEISDLGLRPSNNLIKSQLVLAMTHGVTLTLCKEDFFSVADNVINELFPTNLIM